MPVPYGVAGSVKRILKAAATAASDRVFVDKRPEPTDPYPCVRIVVADGNLVEYDFNGHKTKRFRVSIESYGATDDVAESLGRQCEVAMESVTLKDGVVTYDSATPDAIETEDAGGERTYQEPRSIGPGGSRPYVHVTNWGVMVYRMSNPNRATG